LAAMFVIFYFWSHDPGGSLTFLVLGDWGSPGSNRDTVLGLMKNVRSSLGTKFVISTGDNFYKNGVMSRHHSRFRMEFEEPIGNSFGKWYLVLGNHDVRGSAIAQIEYSKINSLWRMPARYFIREEIVSGSKFIFIFLDTNSLLCHIPNRGDLTPLERNECKECWFEGREEFFVKQSVQLDWLKEKLEGFSNDENVAGIFITGHHPLFSTGPHGDPPVLRKALLPIFDKHDKILTYFCGHNHGLEHYEIKRKSGKIVHQIMSGSGAHTHKTFTKRDAIEDRGLTITQKLSKGSNGFVSTKLTTSLLEISFHEDKGEIVHEVKQEL